MFLDLEMERWNVHQQLAVGLELISEKLLGSPNMTIQGFKGKIQNPGLNLQECSDALTRSKWELHGSADYRQEHAAAQAVAVTPAGIPLPEPKRCL